jgi:hypothetical protein
MKKLLLSFLFLLCLLNSCADDENILESKLASYDVFVAGKENNMACYWKNGVKTDLTAGTGYKARKIFVTNNDIYILGTDQSAITNGINYYYWKNNVKHAVAQDLGLQANTATDFYFSMSDFFVKNGDLYVAGIMKNPAATTPQNQYQFCYWKNGVKTVIFEQNGYSTSASLHLIGNDIYVPLTSNFVNSSWDFGYYKNGVYTFVGVHSNFSGIHETGGLTKMLVSNHSNQTVYYRDLNSGAVTAAPSFINFPGEHYSTQTDGSNQYYIGRTDFYKNNAQFPMFAAGNNFKILDDFKVIDDNIYKILHTDDNTGVNFKVYINDVIVLSTQNPVSSINTEYSNLAVIAN